MAAGKQMGVGGTTQVSKNRENDASVAGGGGGNNKAAIAGASGAGVIGGGQVAFLMMIINWLKGLMMMLAAMLMNALQMIFAFIMFVVGKAIGFLASLGAGVMAAVNGVLGFFGAVANAGGTALGAVGNAIVGGATAVAVTGAMVFSGAALANGDDMTRRSDALIVDCTEETRQKLVSENASPTDVTGATNDNAKTVYSVFKAWGMPDENIAGIIGNWDMESGVDPTSVEGIFDERQTIGPRKQAAWDANFTGYGYGSYSVEYRGIGLGQWTNGRNQNLIKYAQGHREAWYSIKTQLGFMLSAAEGSDADVVKDMIKNSQGTPQKAAVYFHNKWERSADASTAARENAAASWMGKFAGWQPDKALADSILAQSGASLGAATADATKTVLANCQTADKKKVTGGLLTDGGLDAAAAQSIANLYNAEGDAFLDGRYGQYGGPGSCGMNHAMNCVSFSTYFLNKYTTYQHYPSGNGIQTARTVAEDTGKPLSSVPQVYSVASGPTRAPEGHTLIVVGVEGDNVVTIEAGYCSFMGRVTVYSAADMAAKGWVFVNLSDMMLPSDQIKTS